MAKKNNLLGNFAMSIARYTAYQAVKDLKKEFNISVVPNNSKLKKSIRDFEVKGFRTTANKLISMLDMIEVEWQKDKSTTKLLEFREAISFINSKIAVIEYQMSTENDDTIMMNLNSYYSKVKNSLK
jgi:hypothetical protein